MDGRIKDGKSSGNYEKSLPSLFNPSLTLLCTCKPPPYVFQILRLTSSRDDLSTWRGDRRKTAGMKRSRRAEIKKTGRCREDWVKRSGRKQKRRIMKNFVLLIVPPVSPPTCNILNSLHNFTPVGFYRHVSAQPSGFQTPPQSTGEAESALILMTDRKKRRLEGHFYTLDWIRVSAPPLFVSETRGDSNLWNNLGFTWLVPVRLRPWMRILGLQ